MVLSPCYCLPRDGIESARQTGSHMWSKGERSEQIAQSPLRRGCERSVTRQRTQNQRLQRDLPGQGSQTGRRARDP